jgi:hypothetical protein
MTLGRAHPSKDDCLFHCLDNLRFFFFFEGMVHESKVYFAVVGLKGLALSRFPIIK